MPAEAATPVVSVIVNPLSGERIIIRTRPGAAGDTLAWELILAPGGRVPSSHAHPEQEERFTMLDGTMRFRVGRRRLVAGPGETVRVPPGTVHHFANAGAIPARVSVETTPALGMAELLAVAAELAHDQQAAGRSLPRPLDLALFMGDFEREVRAPYLPAVLVRAITRPLAWLARTRGLDAGYRRLRARHDPAARPDMPGRPAADRG
jgi:quercetin dioxygenase-like cupin family protein